MPRRRKLNSESSKQEFERRYEAEGYSKERADRIYGATVEKVAEEQAEHEPSGIKVEHVKGHIAFSDRGRRYRVRPHQARVRAHAQSHSRGHHRGLCDAACRRGQRSHPHGESKRAT
jgi:hypothetical protein